jgi:hypothetical protein
MVIPELNKLKHTLETNGSFEATCLPTLKEDLIASIDRRWPNYEMNSLYAAATMVDPRYKDCAFANSSAVAYARTIVLQEMVLHSTTQSTTTSDSGASAQPTPTTSGIPFHPSVSYITTSFFAGIIFHNILSLYHLIGLYM